MDNNSIDAGRTRNTPKRLVTHSEDFHTDDVFATAMLLELFPDAEVIRSRDPAVIDSADIVYDVGRIYDPASGRFDHHQAEAGRRGNGIVYSSFGLLWQEYGLRYCGGDAAVAKTIDERLVMPVDANDNGQAISRPVYDGIEPFSVDSIVRIFNPLQWQDQPEDHDQRFSEAVVWAGGILRRLRAAVSDDLRSQAAFLEAYATAEDKRVVVMDKPAAVTEVAGQCPELYYVVSARPDGSWGALAVSDAADRFVSRRPFPEAWRALPAAELAAVSGVPDARFCHANGFLATAGSRQGALALTMASLTDTRP